MSFGVDQLSVAYRSRRRGSAHRREVRALDRVDLEVDPGDVVVVAGGDGAGKTTLLRALVGLVRPTAGRISAPGREAVGYLPATSGVYPDLTCAENLDFSGRAHGVRGDSLRRRRDSLLERMRLGGASGRLGAQLSGGMRQKLALAMALIHRPQLLVLDEPSTGLDPVSRRELWLLIRDAAADGAAVVLATTYLDEAERASKLLVLDDGSVLLSGTPRQVTAAAPGQFWTASDRDGELAWRRGAVWRAWASDAAAADRVRVRVTPDLQDVVILAALHQLEAVPA